MEEMIETKEIIEKLKTLGAGISEAVNTDGNTVYAIDISTISDENARLVVAQLLDSITDTDNGN